MISSPSSSLILSGSSFLFPTLRIDRCENSESLSKRISQILRSKNNDKKKKWVVPIVLDLAAFAPDGSPHYIPPKVGMMDDIIRTLGEFGIVVVGFTNYSPDDDELAGLPSLVSKGSVLNNTPKFNIKLGDVIHMVLDKNLIKEERKRKVIKSNENSGTLSAVTDHEETHLSTATTKSEDVHSLNETHIEKNILDNEITDDLAKISSNNNSFVYYGSVRSGQQMMPPRKGQALVIIGSVNSGGEVMSDSDIYIFGKLKGRALAGLCNSATNNAKIVATHFDPELICIGNTFTTVDDVVKEFDLKKSGQAAIVTLSDGQLAVEEMNNL